MGADAFAYRGFMLDSARHFMPPENIRKLLDAAQALGLNVMHWHLTDDQGWRLEIRKYPRLTEVGAVRGDSCFGDVSATENNCGFYTQEEVRDLVAYAAERGIGILPEIELPGHATALLAACPEYGCTAEDGGRWENRVETTGGIFAALVCAGKDETLRFIRDVMDEAVSLFPYPAVHIGGDEALKIRWRRCRDCQRRIRELGLASEDGLQRWLVLETGGYLAAKGRKTVVWNDVLAGGMLPEHFIVQHWMGNDGETRAFMEAGGSVICSDTAAYYLDYPYGQTDVKKMWAYPTVPAWAEGLEDRLLGLECPLWTERISSLERAAYMLFPRLCAMSVKASRPEGTDWPAFLAGVRKLQQKTDALGLRGAPESLWELSEEEAARDRLSWEEQNRTEATRAQIEQERRLVEQDRAEREAR